MEEFIRDVKEINQKAKGLTPDVLRYKVLFGDIIFHHKEKHLTRNELDLTLTYCYNNRSVANLISFNNQKFVNMAAKYGIISSASGATPYFVMGSRLYKDIPNSRWAEFLDALVETENEPEPAVKLYEPYPVFAPFPIANGDQLSDPVAFAILAEDVDAMTADKVKMDYSKFDEPKYENKLYLPTGLPSYPPEYV